MTQFFLDTPFIRQNAITAINKAPQGYVVEIKEPSRDLIYNRKMWAMLKDVSDQVEWHGEYLDTESWKGMLTAALTKEIPKRSICGKSLVLIGKSTRKMSNKFFQELIELIYAFGVEHQVVWSEKATSVIEEYLMSLNG